MKQNFFINIHSKVGTNSVIQPFQMDLSLSHIKIKEVMKKLQSPFPRESSNQQFLGNSTFPAQFLQRYSYRTWRIEDQQHAGVPTHRAQSAIER